MRPYLRILIGLLIILLGIYSIKQAYGGIDAGLLSEFQYAPFILLIIGTIVALILDTRQFENSRKTYQYVTSLVGVIFCVIVVFKFIHNSSIDNSKTLLRVSNLPGATNVLDFEFKKNGNFRLAEYNLLGHKIFYGKYSRNKDTLNIISSNYNGYVQHLPQTGIVQKDTVYWDKFDTMLVDKR
jgi:hypothetical protein